MKEGLTLNEMAAEITRQNSMKEDYLVDTRSLQMEPYDSQIYLHTSKCKNLCHNTPFCHWPYYL